MKENEMGNFIGMLVGAAIDRSDGDSGRSILCHFLPVLRLCRTFFAFVRLRFLSGLREAPQTKANGGVQIPSLRLPADR